MCLHVMHTGCMYVNTPPWHKDVSIFDATLKTFTRCQNCTRCFQDEHYRRCFQTDLQTLDVYSKRCWVDDTLYSKKLMSQMSIQLSSRWINDVTLSQMFFSLLHSSRCLRCIWRLDVLHGDGNRSICMSDGTTWMFYISWCHFLILIFKMVWWHWRMFFLLRCIALDVFLIVLQHVDVMLLMASVPLFDVILRRLHIDALLDASVDKVLGCLWWQTFQDVETSMFCCVLDWCREVLDALWCLQTRCTVWDVIVPKKSLMPRECTKDVLDEISLDGENSWWVNLILIQVIGVVDDLKMMSNFVPAPGIDVTILDGFSQMPGWWSKTNQIRCLWRRCVQSAFWDQPRCGCDGLQWMLAQSDVPPGMSKVRWNLDDLLEAKMLLHVFRVMFNGAWEMPVFLFRDVEPNQVTMKGSQVVWWFAIWSWCGLLIDFEALRDVQGKMVSHQTQRCHCQKMGDALGDLHDVAKNLMLYQMAAGMHKTMQNEASNDAVFKRWFPAQKSDAKVDVHGLPKDVQKTKSKRCGCRWYTLSCSIM